MLIEKNASVDIFEEVDAEDTSTNGGEKNGSDVSIDLFLLVQLNNIPRLMYFFLLSKISLFSLFYCQKATIHPMVVIVILKRLKK